MPEDNHHSKNEESTEHVDAVHIRFREKGPIRSYHCFDCSENFHASSILEVFEHYVHSPHAHYYSDCLYCHGKVHRYKDADSKSQYYHNCNRWKRQIDK